jgi:hypothetical protein
LKSLASGSQPYSPIGPACASARKSKNWRDTASGGVLNRKVLQVRLPAKFSKPARGGTIFPWLFLAYVVILNEDSLGTPPNFR